MNFVYKIFRFDINVYIANYVAKKKQLAKKAIFLKTIWKIDRKDSFIDE